MTMPQNMALWTPKRGTRFATGPAPYTRPAADEIVELIGDSPLAGTLAITAGSIGPTLSIASRAAGSRRIATAPPAALASGAYRAAPPTKVVGSGLEAIPEAIELLRRGVSATKLVVTI